MPSSWAQHKTLVVQESIASIRQIFEQSSRATPVAVDRPHIAADGKSVYFVQEGAVDLFLTDLVEGRPVGRRHHFVRIEAGELFFGVPPLPTRESNRHLALIAVGVAETKVLTTPSLLLVKTARAVGASDAAHGLVDIWVQRLSEALAPERRPQSSVELLPSRSMDLEPGITASAGPKTLWLRHVSGSSKLVGEVSIKATDHRRLIPLTRASWFVTDGARIETVDTQTYFKQDPRWSSLQYFHRLALYCGARGRMRRLENEAKVAHARARSEVEVVDRALQSLTIVRPEDHDPAAADVGTGRPLVVACRAVGRAMKVEMKEPDVDASHAVSIDMIARASRVRSRSIVLSGRWWEMGGGPLLGRRAADDEPVALLPRRWKGYDAFDPHTGTRVRITEANASQIAGDATQFYRPLPSRSLNALDLVRFSMHGNGKDVAILWIASILLGLLGMVVPYATGDLIETIIPGAEVGALVTMGILLVTVAFATGFIQFAQGVAAVRIETRASSAVQAAIWDRVLSLPVPFFRKYGAGDLAERAGGIDTIRQHLSGGALNAILSGSFALMNFALLVHYDGGLAIAAAILALIGVLLALATGIATLVLQRRLADMEGRLSSRLLELLTGIQKLRIAGAENRAFGVWAKLFGQKRDLEYTVHKIENRFDVVRSMYPPLTTIVIFYLVSDSVRAGNLQTGEFIAFYAAFGLFLAGLLSLVGEGISLVHLLPVYERAKPILQAEPEVDSVSTHPGQLNGEIQVSRCVFRYDKEGPPVLNDVDFTIRAGEMVAIVGSTAAGKSTLLRVMLGFEKPESGGVYYGGQDLSTLDVVEVRRQLGVVLQHGELIAGDIFENIVGSRPLTLDDAWEGAEMAGIADEIRALPMGMHTVISQGGKSLSGGQQQRLRIARAIVHKPRIVFFDEATSALDNRAQAQVSESLERLNATRIVVAHRLSTIRNADRIIVLEHGRVVEQGTFEDLMTEDGVFAELARRQMA